MIWEVFEGIFWPFGGFKNILIIFCKLLSLFWIFFNYYLVILKILEVCLSFYRSYSRVWFQWVIFFPPCHVSSFKSILVILKILWEFWRFWEGKQIILENLEEFCHFGDFKGIFRSFKGFREFWLFWKLKGYLVILKILVHCLRPTSRKSPQILFFYIWDY